MILPKKIYLGQILCYKEFMVQKGKIDQLLGRRIAEVIVFDDLEKDLLSGKKLRIKFGIDPTSPLLHLGHSVPLLKLREFQKLGHQIVLIIGDFTAKIGDPSGRTTARKVLAEEKIWQNMKTYKEQAGKILDLKKVEFHKNSKWLSSMKIEAIAQLMSKATMAQVYQRREFKQRLTSGQDVTFLEMLYPIWQAYDSVAVKADVELGGTDQKFNLLMGRQIQKKYGQKPQNIVLVPLLVGTDGTRKMSKSENNFIALTAEPTKMFIGLMSIPDGQILNYFRLCTDVLPEEITNFSDMAAASKVASLELKKRLAREVVKMYYGERKAQQAENHFEKTVQKGRLPSEIKEKSVQSGKWRVEDLLMALKLAPSKSEAKRLIKQGGVAIGGSRVENGESKIKIKNGDIVRVGKKRYVRIRLKTKTKN